MAFNGNFEHTLDTKHRLTVPSKLRAQLAGKVFLVRGPDRCISVYPEPTYSAMTDIALARLNPMSPEAREMRRVLYGNALEIELDSAGRVMLPPGHRSFAGIDRQVMIVGTGPALELWDLDAWKAYETDLTARASELTAALGHPA